MHFSLLVRAWGSEVVHVVVAIDIDMKRVLTSLCPRFAVECILPACSSVVMSRCGDASDVDESSDEFPYAPVVRRRLGVDMRPSVRFVEFVQGSSSVQGADLNDQYAYYQLCESLRDSNGAW